MFCHAPTQERYQCGFAARDVRGTQVDLQLESGEYFLKPTERKRREERERKQKVCLYLQHHATPVTTFAQQTEATAKRRAERAEAFVAPAEAAAPTVEDRRKRKRRELEAQVDGEDQSGEGRVGKKKKNKVKE